MYRKIHDAGKLIQVFTPPGAQGYRVLGTIAEQVGTAEGIILIGGVRPEDRADAETFLEQYGVSA